ncbi:superoxide dismutase family protein [Acidovorax sp. NCPPB 4044]|uniref:superoxide dismutase family protein n=1 Tax=Acidovorax sp. NCPPB 4044 TaxID=2940490 RepID=UPI002303C966|nr:superoxide dismutase family protein [Acidovorax sp. NCPPB 4044]MDA8523642.1 superoxide dismutase family protein [Acidovorax sp. NCPPB 4044]
MTHSFRNRAPYLTRAACAAAFLLGGCAALENYDMPAAGASRADASRGPGTGMAPERPERLAAANVALKTASGAPAGRALLRELPQGGGVEIAIEVQDMAPGAHGFHIHAHGACAPGPDAATGKVVEFGAAGGHFDPYMTRNHGRPGQPPQEAHAGEAPNIQVGANRQGTLRFTHPHVTLQPGSKTSVLGRTLIVHDKEDDYASDPAGNSGDRLACGLIEPAEPSMVQGRATIEGSNVYPEGIAFDARTGMAYVGSSSEGHIYRIAPAAQKAELFQLGGSPGRQAAFGMKVDGNGRLWVAGGPANSVAAIDLQNAATVAVIEGPKDSQAFLNDIALTPQYAYVTDSFRPVLWRIAIAPGAPMSLEPWLDLRQTPIHYQPNQINLNGIVASPDGRRLFAVLLATGQLWRIDTATREVTEVRLEGGGLRHGDGLALMGSNDLYVVRNADNELVRVELAADGSSGRIVQRLRDPRLKYPTTAAVQDGALLVVNGQLDRQKNPPPLLPFDVLRIALPLR